MHRDFTLAFVFTFIGVLGIGAAFGDSYDDSYDDTGRLTPSIDSPTNSRGSLLSSEELYDVNGRPKDVNEPPNHDATDPPAEPRGSSGTRTDSPPPEATNGHENEDSGSVSKEKSPELDVKEALEVDKGNESVATEVLAEKNGASNLGNNNNTDSALKLGALSSSNPPPVVNLDPEIEDPPVEVDESPGLRGDTDPYDSSTEAVDNSAVETSSTEAPFFNFSASASSSTEVGMHNTYYKTMSWLDSFMFQHRDTLWIVLNTFFMVIWILVGGLSLYRLLGLPWCSPYVSRTQYLVIHLLIFTAATFAFVQLIHLSYGSHEGLPLFLTLLLTHTPTPCLAVSLIIMTYCIFVSTRVPIFGSYLPPLLYVGVLVSFVIVLSFVGDIIVGVSRNSVFLIIIRVSLVGLCLACLLAYIVNYRKIVGVALLMRMEFRGELKSLAIPVESVEENQDAKLHLKRILLTWARITLVSCISGVLMCIFSFCLSLFFTVSFVPLWAFWLLHSCIFISQIMVVVSLTFGAAYTLTHNNGKNIFYKYFLPSFPSSSPASGSFIKRGNFIYQRVSVVNGPNISRVGSPPLAEVDEQSPLRSNIITELSTPPYRPRVNLRRSATFNCAPPYGFPRVVQPHTSKLYPVLSDHVLPYSNHQMHPNINEGAYCEAVYPKPSLQLSHSFSQGDPEKRNYSHYNYMRGGHPLTSFQGQDRFSSLSNISNSGQRRSIASPTSFANGEEAAHANARLAGTVEALDVSYHAMNSVPVDTTEFNSSHNSFLRQIPHNHSFSSVDRRRMRQDVPEKPARKTEPILVRSVIKDVYSENNHLAPKTSKGYSPTDPNIYSAERKTNEVLVRSCYVAPNITLNASSPSGSGIGRARVPDTKNIFNFNSPPICPNPPPPKCPEPAASPLFYAKVPVPLSSSSSTSPSLCDGSSASAAASASHSTSEATEPPKEAASIARPNGIDDVVKPKVNGCGLEPPSDIDSLSPSSTDLNMSFDSSVPPPVPTPKNCSLKRNHSTAGDFSPPAKIGEEGQQDDKSLPGMPQGTNEKYPWYGTWGGRRRSKRRDTGSDTSSINLRRLSASKSSLSNLYEKLKKPRKAKSTHHDTHGRGSEEPSSGTTEGEDESVLDMNVTPEEEEEEEFLPRLDEDIDLAADILKSSTVLADFYSLKRSDLKKRREEKKAGGEGGKNEQEGENEQGGEGKLNGANGDIESMKSLELDNTS